MLSDYCIKCGKSLQKAMIEALLIDLGVHTNIDPLHCPNGEDHEFVEKGVKNETN